MHTISLSRRAVMRDVEAGISRATLELTAQALVVRVNLRCWEHLRIRRTAVTAVLLGGWADPHRRL